MKSQPIFVCFLLPVKNANAESVCSDNCVIQNDASNSSSLLTPGRLHTWLKLPHTFLECLVQNAWFSTVSPETPVKLRLALWPLMQFGLKWCPNPIIIQVGNVKLLHFLLHLLLMNTLLGTKAGFMQLTPLPKSFPTFL